MGLSRYVVPLPTRAETHRQLRLMLLQHRAQARTIDYGNSWLAIGTGPALELETLVVVRKMTQTAVCLVLGKLPSRVMVGRPRSDTWLAPRTFWSFELFWLNLQSPLLSRCHEMPQQLAVTSVDLALMRTTTSSVARPRDLHCCYQATAPSSAS